MPLSYVEGQPVLQARLDAVKLGDAKRAVIDGGITCAAELAFISSYTPGVQDNAPLIAAFETLLNRQATLTEKSNFRRFFNEAYAAVTMDIRSKIESVDDRAARRLTQPERHDSYLKQSAKLSAQTRRPSTSLCGRPSQTSRVRGCC